MISEVHVETNIKLITWPSDLLAQNERFHCGLVLAGGWETEEGMLWGDVD